MGFRSYQDSQLAFRNWNSAKQKQIHGRGQGWGGRVRGWVGGWVEGQCQRWNCKPSSSSNLRPETFATASVSHVPGCWIPQQVKQQTQAPSIQAKTGAGWWVGISAFEHQLQNLTLQFQDISSRTPLRHLTFQFQNLTFQFQNTGFRTPVSELVSESQFQNPTD